MSLDSANVDIHNSSIFVMKKNGELVEQAIIEETKLYENNTPNLTCNITVHPLPVHVAHMEEYFQELYSLMMKYEHDYPYNYGETYQTKTYEFINEMEQGKFVRAEQREFIRAVIFHRVLMRKGSYFYVLQQSDRGVRFLLYAMNRVHHSSIAFGCTMITPKPREELTSMREILEQFTMKQIRDLNIMNFDTLVSNDSLYFL